VVAAIRYRILSAELSLAEEKIHALLTLRAGFRPDQPRAPAGTPEGGQWIDGSVILVGRRPRSGGPTRVGNRWLDATLGQQVRLDISLSPMRSALRDVRRVDPKWRPTPQMFESIEGQIAANLAVAGQARFRLIALELRPFGPGPFAQEWIPAPRTNRRLNKEEQAAIDRLGTTFGCHRCGSRVSGTTRGHFVGDHQVSKSIGQPTRVYPHCLGCSQSQGGLVKNWNANQ
jgi:ribosomal protein L34E